MAEVLAELRDRGWTPGLTPESYEGIMVAGFRRKTLPLACVATEILCDEQPITLRGLFYRVVSAGWLPDTGAAHYNALGRLTVRLREAGVVPFAWLVDNGRATQKPSSWSGLQDFSETVRRAYRKDFWASLPEYAHVFVEKDAMAGVIVPTTREFDVALSVCRGFASLSFAHSIASEWAQIEKPIFAYYLGDLDPSGLDLERDLRAKLERYCGRPFAWQRLAVVPEDFERFALRALAPKQTDTRTRRFTAGGYSDCAELDAIPATALRDRVRDAIVQHVPMEQWARLEAVEHEERRLFEDVMRQMGRADREVAAIEAAAAAEVAPR